MPPPRRIPAPALHGASSASETALELISSVAPARPTAKAASASSSTSTRTGLFDLRYSVTNRVEQHVRALRILCCNPLVTTARSRSLLSPERPSLLSTAHRPRARPAGAAASASLRGKTKVTQCVSQYYKNNASSARKPQYGSGLTVFNSDKKRKEVFTPLEYFKRRQRKRHNEPVSEKQLVTAFHQLDDDMRRQCVHGAESLRLACSGIHHEIEAVLKQTNGIVGWREMAEYIAGGPRQVQPVSKDALRRHIMSTNDFRYSVTQTLPQCKGEQSRR